MAEKKEKEEKEPEATRPDEILPTDINSLPIASGLPEELLTQGKVIRKIEAPYLTAVTVQNPRDMNDFIREMKKEADIAGSGFYYRWMVKTKDGPKPVQGPTIGLALAMARRYQNCAIDIKADETPTHFLFDGTFIDLENGFTIRRPYRQRKVTNMGDKMKQDPQRAEDLVFQNGASRCMRNVIVMGVPQYLTDEFIEEAKKGEAKKITEANIGGAIETALQFFVPFSGLDYDTVKDRLQKHFQMPWQRWAKSQVIHLRESASAIAEGIQTFDQLFPAPDIPAPDTPPDPEEDKQGSFGKPE